MSYPENNFYLSNYNSFLAPMTWKVYSYYFVYTGVVIIILLFYVFNRRSHKNVHAKQSLRFSVFVGFWLSWAFIVGIQTWHQNDYFRKVLLEFCHFSVGERYHWIFPDSFPIARELYEAVPADGSAKLIRSVPPGGDIRVIPYQYLLFPRLDFVHPVHAPEYIVLFPQSDVPPGQLADYQQVAVIQQKVSLWRKKLTK